MSNPPVMILLPIDLARVAQQFLARVTMNGQEALPFVQVQMGLAQAIKNAEAVPEPAGLAPPAG